MLSLKGNQGLLHEEVKDYFEVAYHADFKQIPHDYYETVDKGHGRHEVRKHWIVDDLSTLPKTEQWKSLQSIGMIQRECMIAGKTTLHSLSQGRCASFCSHSAYHWEVENSLHGVWMSPFEKMIAVYGLAMHQR